MRNFFTFLLTFLWSYLVFGQTLTAPVFNDNQFLLEYNGDGNSGSADFSAKQTTNSGGVTSNFIGQITTPIPNITGTPNFIWGQTSGSIENMSVWVGTTYFRVTGGANNYTSYLSHQLSIPADRPAMRFSGFKIARLPTNTTGTGTNNINFSVEIRLFDVTANTTTVLTGIGSATTNSEILVLPTTNYDLLPGRTYQVRWHLKQNINRDNVYVDNPKVYIYVIPNVLSTNNTIVLCPNQTTNITALNSKVTSTAPSGYVIRWFRNTETTPLADNASGLLAGTYTPYYYRNTATVGYHPAGNPVTVSNTNLAINTQPVGQTLCQGQAFNQLSVSSTGATTYQWYRDSVIITGATASTYIPTQAGTYYVVVGNANGCTTQSSNAVLTINPQPAIQTQPQSQTLCAGGTFNTLSVGASTATAFQWYRNSVIITGATASTYTPTEAGTYYVIVRNASGCGSRSNDAVVTVNALPIITTQPVGQTLCQGQAFNQLSVVATGATTYQWYRNGLVINLATASTYTPTQAGNYYVVVGNANGCTLNSNTVTVTVNTYPVITTQPIDNSFCVNQSIDQALQVIVSGTGYTYQWFESSDGTTNTGTAVGTNSFAYTPSSSVVGTRYYYVVVSNGNCSVTSRVAAITISPLVTCNACYKTAHSDPSNALTTSVGISTLNRDSNNDDWLNSNKGAWIVLESNTKGFVLNRLTDAQVLSIPAANLEQGMAVFNTDKNCLQVNIDGTATGWRCFRYQGCPDVGSAKN